MEKAGESWIQERKGPQHLGQVPPSLAHPGWNRAGVKGIVDFPLCPRTPDNSLRLGSAHPAPFPAPPRRALALAPSWGWAVPSLPWPQAGLACNSSVSCCQGCQDVTSSRWASDQWTPSLSKDGGAGGGMGERPLMDGPRSSDGWAGRSCHLSWEVSDSGRRRREGG